MVAQFSPALLLAALLDTTPPAPPPEPVTAPPISWQQDAGAWQVESPGALGVRYGIGLDYLFDRTDDLELVGGQTIVDFGQRPIERPLDPDESLDLDWEQTVIGVQVPVALSTGRIVTTLVVEAATVDGSFELHDPRNDEPDDVFFRNVENDPRSRTTLEGRGNRFGLGFEAAGSLCGACRWSWSGGYRFRALRGLDLDQDPGSRGNAFNPLVEQDGELESDDHELTARLGVRLAGGRFTPWLGVRGSRSESDLEHTRSRVIDGVVFEDALRLETEAERIGTLVGADFRLGRSLVGRVEGTFGDGGETVLVKVVSFPGLWGRDDPPGPYRPEPRPRPQPTADEEPSRRDAPEEVERQDRRADQLADELAPRARELRQRFHERAGELLRDAGPRGALPAGAVRALLDDVERELRQILDTRELRPALAWFVDFAERSRRELAEPPTVSHRRGPSPRSTGSYRLAAFSPAPQPKEDRGPADPDRGILTAIGRFLDTLTARADSRQLAQPLCVRSRPSAGAKVRLSAALPGSEGKTRLTEGTWDVFYRGLYAYQASLGGRSIACPADRDPAECDFLDFWDDNGPFVLCDFRDGVEVCVIDEGNGDTCGGR